MPGLWLIIAVICGEECLNKKVFTSGIVGELSPWLCSALYLALNSECVTQLLQTDSSSQVLALCRCLHRVNPLENDFSLRLCNLLTWADLFSIQQGQMSSPSLFF